MEAEKPTLLLIDLSYQCYRASAAHARLTSSEGVFTGGIYGFLTSMASTIRNCKADRVVLCQDRKPYLRSKTYPEYKLLRKAAQDDELLERHKESMPLIIECAMEVLGWPIWGLDGFESDDLVAFAAQRYRHRFGRIYAASNDSDLYQLFDLPNFFIYRKEDDLMSRGRLWLEQKLTPEQFMLASALQGTHNDIAGIPKVGPVTARKAVLDPAALRKLRDGYGELIDRNLALIKLPHPEFPSSARLPGPTLRFDRRKLYRWAAQFDIDATLSMLDAFERTS